MSGSNGSQGGFLSDLRQGSDQFLFLCRALAFPVEVCVTRFGTWGPRYLDFSSVLGFFWPLFFLAFIGPYPDDEVRGVLRFWCGLLGLLLIHRVTGIRRRIKGHRCHSRYWGTSRFAWASDPPGSDRSDARECVIVVGVALLTVAVSRPLTLLLLIGSIALLVTRLAVRREIEARLREMEDLRIENEFYFERYRDRTDRE